MRGRLLPLTDRKTPILNIIRRNPERPLLGILAETPEEIRSLRRGIVTGITTTLAFTLLLTPFLARIPKEVRKSEG